MDYDLGSPGDGEVGTGTRSLRGPRAVVRVAWSALAGCPALRRHVSKDAGWRELGAAAMRQAPALHLGLIFLFAVAFAGILVPLFSPYGADQLLPNARLQAPSLAHPFGTDALGRDLLTRVASGSHLAARIAFLSVSISLAIGLVLGSLAGYYRGWTDQILSRTVDGWMALPGALVAVVIVARLGASLDNLILALGIMGIPSFYRIVRNTTLSARHMPYAEAAAALGATDRRVMWRHVFPNILSPLLVLTSMRLGTVLLTGSSLSFIGLGAQPPMPEWGALLAAGKNYLDSAWWLSVFPGLAVTLSVVGMNLLGDGLRDLLDPQQGEPSASGQPSMAPKRRKTRSDGETTPRLACPVPRPVGARSSEPVRLPPGRHAVTTRTRGVEEDRGW